ncbi:glycerol-3-phosphate acyltransferase [Lottiidibacillus patelloidae]|uniref:Glycerol-3-phosphate acyltransferase n=1 Tax=Lottiidibacillus patelloidae TaxID=2670334 RepID=A0A263BUJ4_9BACI|nr:glycerol-3-phosphate 1-O-acyltransferase PlsY [Lottiidibacillus patelloidae]OZM57404.1 glycerol-3-phosphate acyltransferase [Lottiidibacillus patelloidae]
MYYDYLLYITAYLLGSIPFALIVGKIGYGKDIREYGSGNLGGTNTFRTLGVKAGLLVSIADLLKGTLAAFLPVIFAINPEPSLLLGVIAVIGHVYPVFAKFQGGKAVATSGGVFLAYHPLLFITSLIAFFLFLYLTKYVSLSSMLTAIYSLIFSIFIKDLWLIVAVLLLGIFVFYRHRANIKRIMNKTEPKIKWL